MIDVVLSDKGSYDDYNDEKSEIVMLYIEHLVRISSHAQTPPAKRG
jgi:hypothetical protein